MDDDEEDAATHQIQLIVLALAIFFGSGYAAWTEFRYLAWGRSCTAIIERAREDGDGEDLTLYYRFTDHTGQERSEQDTVSTDWNVPRQGPLFIQYIAGSKSSRIAGHSQIWLVYVFLICFAALIGAIAWLCRLANQPIRRSAARRRR